MIVLQIVGVLLGIVLGLILVLTVFTFGAPLRVELKRKPADGQIKLRIGFGPIKKVFTLGKRKRSAKQRAAQPKQQQKTTKKKRQKAPSFDVTKLDYAQAVSLLLTLIDDMAGAMTWEKLHVTVLLHTSDAAKTGELLGVLSAAVGNIYPYLERAFVLQDTKIVLDADFDAEKTVWSMDIAVMTRLSRFLRTGWKRRKALWAIWKSIRTTKEERKTWNRDHTVSSY